jgi:hypothetical protein
VNTTLRFGARVESGGPALWPDMGAGAHNGRGVQLHYMYGCVER